MRVLIAVTLVAVSVMLSGCVPSLFPLYHESDLTSLPELVGTWEESSEEGENDLWRFDRADSNSYALTYYEDSVPALFEAHVLKLQDKFFIDISPEQPELANDLQKALLLPVHLFGLLSLKEDTLRIAWLDGEWVKRMIEKGTVSITHAIVDSDFLLTASPSELQAFVLQHLDDPEAFPVTAYSRVVE